MHYDSMSNWCVINYVAYIGDGVLQVLELL